jgi:hypothetical protein
LLYIPILAYARKLLHPPARQYPNPARALVIRARPLRNAGSVRFFPAEICWDGDQPLHPGDRAWVTVTVTDDDAGSYFDAGQRFTLWGPAATSATA